MEDTTAKLNSLALSELAPLFAIASLDETESDQVKAQCAEDPEFAEDVAAFEVAVASLAYTVPSVPMAPDLKQRLMARITQEEEISEETSELLELLSISIEDLRRKAAELTWKEMAIASGFQMATWQIDKAKREHAFFIRADNAVQFPDHAHATGEVILVLDGDVIVGDQTYLEGDRITSEAGSMHGPATRTGCLLLCVSSLDDRIVE